MRVSVGWRSWCDLLPPARLFLGDRSRNGWDRVEQRVGLETRLVGSQGAEVLQVQAAREVHNGQRQQSGGAQTTLPRPCGAALGYGG